MVARSFSAEFPNDNSDLHTGTIWMSTEPCGRPEAHFSDWTDEDPGEPIEIVESLEIEGPFENVPAPEGSSPAVEMVVAVAVEEPPTELPSVELAPAPLEIVVDESLHAELAATAPEAEELGEDDPYAVFIRTLAEVAVASGATMDAATIDALLESDAVATAWRAILRGESEDFSKCAATLDEWAANALASILSAPQKAAQLRRELRARGIAAFGIIDAA